MYAGKGGDLDVVKYLHEAGGEKLLMARDKVIICTRHALAHAQL
jgi:hypothetical protein